MSTGFYIFSIMVIRLAMFSMLNYKETGGDVIISCRFIVL